MTNLPNHDLLAAVMAPGNGKGIRVEKLPPDAVWEGDDYVPDLEEVFAAGSGVKKENKQQQAQSALSEEEPTSPEQGIPDTPATVIKTISSPIDEGSHALSPLKEELEESNDKNDIVAQQTITLDPLFPEDLPRFHMEDFPSNAGLSSSHVESSYMVRGDDGVPHGFSTMTEKIGDGPVTEETHMINGGLPLSGTGQNDVSFSNSGPPKIEELDDATDGMNSGLIGTEEDGSATQIIKADGFEPVDQGSELETGLETSLGDAVGGDPNSGFDLADHSEEEDSNDLDDFSQYLSQQAPEIRRLSFPSVAPSIY